MALGNNKPKWKWFGWLGWTVRWSMLRRIKECDVIPWGYGVAYWRFNTAEAILAPIPLNLVIGLSRSLYFWLAHGWMKIMWLNAPADAAYLKGLKEGQDRENRVHDFWKRTEEADRKREVERAYSRGYVDGRTYVIQDLLKEVREIRKEVEQQ